MLRRALRQVLRRGKQGAVAINVPLARPVRARRARNALIVAVATGIALQQYTLRTRGETLTHAILGMEAGEVVGLVRAIAGLAEGRPVAVTAVSWLADLAHVERNARIIVGCGGVEILARMLARLMSEPLSELREQVERALVALLRTPSLSDDVVARAGTSALLALLGSHAEELRAVLDALMSQHTTPLEFRAEHVPQLARWTADGAGESAAVAEFSYWALWQLSQQQPALRDDLLVTVPPPPHPLMPSVQSAAARMMASLTAPADEADGGDQAAGGVVPQDLCAQLRQGAAVALSEEWITLLCQWARARGPGAAQRLSLAALANAAHLPAVSGRVLATGVDWIINVSTGDAGTQREAARLLALALQHGVPHSEGASAAAETTAAQEAAMRLPSMQAQEAHAVRALFPLSLSLPAHLTLHVLPSAYADETVIRPQELAPHERAPRWLRALLAWAQAPDPVTRRSAVAALQRVVTAYLLPTAEDAAAAPAASPAGLLAVPHAAVPLTSTSAMGICLWQAWVLQVLVSVCHDFLPECGEQLQQEVGSVWFNPKLARVERMPRPFDTAARLTRRLLRAMAVLASMEEARAPMVQRGAAQLLQVAPLLPCADLPCCRQTARVLANLAAGSSMAPPAVQAFEHQFQPALLRWCEQQDIKLRFQAARALANLAAQPHSEQSLRGGAAGGAPVFSDNVFLVHPLPPTAAQAMARTSVVALAHAAVARENQAAARLGMHGVPLLPWWQPDLESDATMRAAQSVAARALTVLHSMAAANRPLPAVSPPVVKRAADGALQSVVTAGAALQTAASAGAGVVASVWGSLPALAWPGRSTAALTDGAAGLQPGSTETVPAPAAALAEEAQAADAEDAREEEVLEQASAASEQLQEASEQLLQELEGSVEAEPSVAAADMAGQDAVAMIHPQGPLAGGRASGEASAGLRPGDAALDADDAALEVDVVLVHGLRGGAFKTWRGWVGLSQCWPADWLPADLASHGVRMRLLTVGYTAHMLSWAKPHKNLPLPDRGRMVLDELVRARVGRDRPVVFITHSMGGLLVKEILLLAARSQDERHRQLARATQGVAFFSTPHAGSNLAKLSPSALQFLLRSSPAVRALRPGDTRLLMLNAHFCKLAHAAPPAQLTGATQAAVPSAAVPSGHGAEAEDAEAAAWVGSDAEALGDAQSAIVPPPNTGEDPWLGGMLLLSMGEELPLKIARFGVTSLVVPPSSANPGCGVFALLRGTNHLDVCKPACRFDERYLRVLSFIVAAARRGAAEGAGERAK